MKLRVPIGAKRFTAIRSIRRALTALVSTLVLAHAVPAQSINGHYVPWDPVDATKNIQKAIDDAVPPARIILENHGAPWNVNQPIIVNKPDIEIWIKGGATVKAMAGTPGFEPRGASLFRIFGTSVKMNGYANGVDLSAGRSTLEMRKMDYTVPPYTPPGDEVSGSRHCISIKGADNPIIQGFKLTQAGGDGICVDVNSPADPANHPYNVVVKDVLSEDNYRQGISVISVDKLTVTNSHFKLTGSTGGGPPRAGVDIEPSRATDLLKDITFTGCSFNGNQGNNVEINFHALTGASAPVNITFDDCIINGGRSNGMAFYDLDPNSGPTGTILVKNTTIQNMKLSALRFSGWGADRVTVTMSNVWFIDCGRNPDVTPVTFRSPILFGTDNPTPRKHGDVAFTNGCRIRESFVRPNNQFNTLVWANQNVQNVGTKDITGSITVDRPDDSNSPLIDLGGGPGEPAPINCTLSVTELLP